MSPSRAIDETYAANMNSQTLGSLELVQVDFPILRNKPTYWMLLKSLEDLEVQPKSWNGISTHERTSNDARSLSQYLLSIISSDLGWLEKGHDDDYEVVSEQKEKLQELASRRLAERCGRSAMPEMMRTWVVPASAKFPELKFEIREPPLTGDNLGLKTWGTAFAIVKKLEEFREKHFCHLLEGKKDAFTRATGVTSERLSLKVLELGSGTGLVGIAAGAIWGATIILTDLPEIHNNLLFNIHNNISIVSSNGGNITGEVLDWKNPDGLVGYSSAEFEIVMAADPLYDNEHPELVARNIKRYIKHHADSRALVAIPMRDKHTESMAAHFRELMLGYSFDLIQQGDEICHDDWDVADEEDAVKCWWGIWSLSSRST